MTAPSKRRTKPQVNPYSSTLAKAGRQCRPTRSSFSMSAKTRRTAISPRRRTVAQAPPLHPLQLRLSLSPNSRTSILSRRDPARRSGNSVRDLASFFPCPELGFDRGSFPHPHSVEIPDESQKFSCGIRSWLCSSTRQHLVCFGTGSARAVANARTHFVLSTLARDALPGSAEHQCRVRSLGIIRPCVFSADPLRLCCFSPFLLLCQKRRSRRCRRPGNLPASALPSIASASA